MGFFDRFKKNDKKNLETTDAIEAAKARVEAINNGKINLEEKYNEEIEYYEEQEAKQRKEAYQEEALLNSRLAELNNRKNNSYASQVARQQIEDIQKEIQKREAIKKQEQKTNPKQADVETPEDKRTAEEIIDIELAKLKEKGLPDKTIEEFRQSDLNFIKEHRGIASEKYIKSRLAEIYGRFNDPQVLNAYKLSAEEYLKTTSLKLAEQGISEEEIQKFYQRNLKEITSNREEHTNIPEWSINQHIYSESLQMINNFKFKTNEEKDTNKRR